MKSFWTDGSAIPNPGKGGYAVIDAETGEPVALGGAENTTNIRMEACAMITAIKLAGEEGCEINTDSEFWINVLTKWAPSWKARNWTKSKGRIQNLDLVKELYDLYHKYPVQLNWVRGHDGNHLNEVADYWADKARKGATL